MGVFGWIRRKSMRTAEEANPVSSAARVTANGAPVAAEAVSISGTDSVAGSESDVDSGTTAAKGVDIPKQQSGDEAADNEAGEGARQ